MKSFRWKIISCVLPILVAAAIVGVASWNYVHGTGGFKLGVDLVGGTLLIYEIDVSKLPDQKVPADTTQKLAERLKSRLDPAGTYDLTVRPVSDTRVEIILPTGGKHQNDAEERNWQQLLHDVKEKWPPTSYPIKADAPNRAFRLMAQISAQYPETPVKDIEQFIKDNAPPEVKDPKEAKDAWAALLKKAAEKYPPKDYVIGRGKTDDLALEMLDQLGNKDFDEIKSFIEKRAQKSRPTQEVQDVKEKVAQVGTLRFAIAATMDHDRPAIEAWEKYFEQVNEKKRGSDELANPNLSKELDDRARSGLPPLPLKDGTKPMKFEASPNLGDYTYSWVELSPSYRWDHALQNPRKDGKLLSEEDIPKQTDYSTKQWLTYHKSVVEGKPFPLSVTDKTGRAIYTALIYGRKVQNLRMPQKDRDQKVYEYFILMRDPEDPAKETTGEQLEAASVEQGAVTFQLRSSAGEQFYQFTKKNQHQPMCIILDGLVNSSPTINEPIRTNGQITGRFTEAQLNRLVAVLQSGALPATLKSDPVSENTMGPTLGQDTITRGIISVGLAFAAILLFMLVYYRFAGLVACIALLANLLLTVAFMVLVQATFTLPGLAGLVLMLGMAVDANVLIYERLREERDRGANLALAIRNGYDRAFPTIIDTHLSSIFTAIVLYVVGNDQLKGFGISLTVGLIISLFTSLFVTRVLFDIWLYKGWLHKLSMFRLFARPNIDFMGIRYYWFTATILLTIIGAAVFIAHLDKGGLNIDFTGGTAYGGELVKKMDIGELRVLVTPEHQQKRLQVTDVEAIAKDQNDRALSFKITYSDGKPLTVILPERTTVEDVRKRASQLPDASVEQLFLSSNEFTEGNKSKLFTIRTSEKAADLVQMAINRLLVDNDDQPLLKLIELDFTARDIDPSNKAAALSFVDPKTHEPVYASRAQVAMILAREFKNEAERLKSQGQARRKEAEELRKAEKPEDEVNKADKEGKEVVDQGERLEKLSQQIVLQGLGKEEDGRFKYMNLMLSEEVPPARLTKIIEAAQTQFKNSPQPERLENFDSQLAAETQTRALYAILASWAAILLYLWFRFGNWTFGLAAVLCLIHDLFFTLGIIGFSHWVHDTWWGQLLGLRDFKIDLPTVAALLTLVGYSVNDTIVVFDRIREVRGKNPDLTPQMINDSVNQTLSRTLLTSFATWLVVVVLYIFGGEGIHLFAFVMVVGVIVGTYSSIYIASPLLLIFGEGRRSTQARDRERQAQLATGQA